MCRPVDLRLADLGRCLVGLAAAFLAPPLPSVNGEEALAVLEPSIPQLISINEGQDPLWICRTEVPSIVWFFASTTDPKASILFRSATGKPGNPVWVRSRGNGSVAAVRLTASAGGRTVNARIWAETEADVDPAEPNDAFNQARRLAGSGEASFYLYPKEDQDWFILSVDSKDERHFEVVLPQQGPSAFRDGLELGICDSAEHPVVQRVGSGQEAGSWLTIPFQLEPGEYRVWVRARGSRSSRAPLTLRLVTGPAAVPVAAVAAPVVVPAIPTSAPREEPTLVEVPAPSPSPVVSEGEAPRQFNPIPWLLLSSGVLILIWVVGGLIRPRRVFDLTR